MAFLSNFSSLTFDLDHDHAMPPQGAVYLSLASPTYTNFDMSGLNYIGALSRTDPRTDKQTERRTDPHLRPQK